MKGQKTHFGAHAVSGCAVAAVLNEAPAVAGSLFQLLFADLQLKFLSEAASCSQNRDRSVTDFAN